MEGMEGWGKAIFHSAGLRIEFIEISKPSNLPIFQSFHVWFRQAQPGAASRFTSMVIGKDIKTDKTVEISLDKSRVVLVTGKRGSGKSYSLGVLAEELYLPEGTIELGEERPLILMVDALGIFFTFCRSNPFLTDGELDPIALPVRLLVPGEPQKRYGPDVVERMETLGVQFHPLRLPPSVLSPSEWCDLPSFGGVGVGGGFRQRAAGDCAVSSGATLRE